MKGLEGQTVGKYELVRTIGEGSMGTVYLARDPFALRDVAVKVATLPPAENERAARRRRKLFFNESKMAGMLRHPNIIATLDAGIDDRTRYLVMEYVAGAQTLDVHCHTDGLLPIERVVSLMLTCALAFDYAHTKGVVHRDIKPKNILLNADSEIKVGDFGVALIDRSDVEETQVMGTLGSPRYMAPEQIMGGNVTNQSDIFSLGVVVFEMLTGVHPFADKTIPAVARRITREPHPSIRELRPGIPDALARVVDRTLKKHPAGRYRNAMDLAGDLSVIYDDMRATAEDASGTHKFRQIKRLLFFEGFEDSDLLEVVSASEFHEYEREQQIIVEGELDNAFYVLVSGEVAVVAGGRNVDFLKPGASFGEIGFLIRSARSASIVARTPVSVLKVEAGLIDRTSVSCQLRFHRAFLKSMATRLSRAMALISKAAAKGRPARSG